MAENLPHVVLDWAQAKAVKVLSIVLGATTTSISIVPDTVLGTSYALTHLILTNNSIDNHYYFSNFIEDSQKKKNQAIMMVAI